MDSKPSQSRIIEWLSPLVYLSSNAISLTGVVIVTAATVLWLFLLPMLVRGTDNIYLGIPGFLILPALFIFGLLLIPAGIFLRKARLRRQGADVQNLPPLTLNSVELRRLFTFVAVTTVINFGIAGQWGYAGINYMDSDQFCGLVCHTVMAPEYAAYRNSPHARVACVECHIGAGASWFVRSKISGTRQLFAVAFHTYEEPIASPVHSLRPARETCEECHWPNRFTGDMFVVRNSYSADDEQNAKTSTVLLMKVGGETWRGSVGIHGAHSDVKGSVDYISTDGHRQVIPQVTYTAANGKVTVFNATDQKVTAAQLDNGEHRRMDCMDCHNRPSHAFQLPERALDSAIDNGRINPKLPSIKKESIAVLRRDYADRDTASREIATSLTQFYQTKYPQSDPQDLKNAVDAVKAIYLQNVFPEMKVSWGTYPNNIGHMDFPGCFRCHDGNHVSSDGQVIPNDCATCHDLLAMDEKNPKVLSDLGYATAQH
ncbi:MAG TPA: NapC/NirT family cytochrome c [Bryobacteraceae bacterium]|nr:NapC/NirT family cytochrome c [Bryobacteraceae bacterium]